MAGLQTTIGLISGIDIKGVVDQLIAIESIPRDNLQKRTEALQAQQEALLQLTNLFNTTTYMMKNLSKVEVFSRRDPKSSNDAILKVTRSGTPVEGNYSFTPIKLAQAQTTMSSGVVSDSVALDKEGEITIKFGRDLGTNYNLSELNGGDGVMRGVFRITDGSGTRANIDVRTAQSMEDVLDAINNCMDIDVYAKLEGDRIVLTDYSGSANPKITVQDVNGGHTAESLGLTGVISDENGVLTGKNLLRLGEDTDLSLLNDGNGVVFDNLLVDIIVKTADGSTINVDLNELHSQTSEEIEAGLPAKHDDLKTVGDLIRTLNAAGKVKITDSDGNVTEVQKFVAGISNDGKRIVFQDLTTGSGDFTITQNAATYYGNPETNPILRSLGFCDYGQNSVTGTGGMIVGNAILGDLDSVLLSSLNGGRGFPMTELVGADNNNAVVGVQDRAGNFTLLSFSKDEIAAAETLEDMVRLVNSKMKNAVLYDTQTGQQIVQRDGNGDPILDHYDNGEPKYPLNDLGALNYRTDMEIVTSADPQTGIHWVFDDIETDKIVGYKFANAQQLIMTPLDVFSTLGKDEFPELDEDGNVKVVKNITFTNDHLTGDGSTGPYGDPITGYSVENNTTSENYGKVIAYWYDDAETGEPVRINFTQDAIDMFPSREDTDEYIPKLHDGVLFDYSFPVDTMSEGVEPTYSFEDNGFEVEWLYEPIDPENPGGDRKVVGYTLQTYTEVELSEEDIDKIAALRADQGPVFAPLIENGEIVREKVIVPIESQPPPNIPGISWVFDGDDPDNQLLGYELGDGTFIEFNEEEKTYFSPGTHLFPDFGALQQETIKVHGDIGLEVRVNDAKTGLDLIDTTGEYTYGMVFADASGKVASMLGLGIANEFRSAAQGTDLNMQTISRNTQISDLNGGAGVNTLGGMISIRDTSGRTGLYEFDRESPKTIGDVIDGINRMSTSVIARINDAGDGILLEDMYDDRVSNPNANDFSVSDIGRNSVASALGIATGTVSKDDRVITNEETGARSSLKLSGTTKKILKVEKTDTLDDIRTKLNDLNAGFKVTMVNDGSAKPYRLSITGSATGAQGKMSVDLSAIGLTTAVASKAQNAAIVFGDPESASSLILTSKTNTINGVVPGISLTIQGTSKDPINVWTEKSSTEIKTSLSSFVENYNKFRQMFNELTSINVTAGTKGIFAMDPTILRLESQMSELILGTFSNLGNIKTLADVGISIVPSSINEETGEVETIFSGKIQFDEDKFNTLFDSDPEALQEFFAKFQEVVGEDGKMEKIAVGFASKFTQLAATYSDDYYSILNTRYSGMTTQIENNISRIEFMDARLETKRNILLKQFYAMESAMARMQSDMNYVNNIANTISQSSSK